MNYYTIPDICTTHLISLGTFEKLTDYIMAMRYKTKYSAEEAVDLIFGLPDNPNDSFDEGDISTDDDNEDLEQSIYCSKDTQFTLKDAEVDSSQPNCSKTRNQVKNIYKLSRKKTVKLFRFSRRSSDSQTKCIDRGIAAIQQVECKEVENNFTESDCTNDESDEDPTYINSDGESSQTNFSMDSSFILADNSDKINTKKDEPAESIDTNGWSNKASTVFESFPNFDTPIQPCGTHNFVHDAVPGEYFDRFFTCEVMNDILKHTNEYIQQKEIINFVDISLVELKAFLGCVIIMGIHSLPAVDHYWSSNPYIRVEAVANVMTCKRFKKIRECLHCNDNLTAVLRGESGFDKLHKVRPLLNFLNKTFVDEYTTSSCQSIDESMIKFKGRNTMKQYMPLKPIKRGYKVWARADPVTGYLSEFEIYTGRKEAVDPTCKDTLGSMVVKNLCEKLYYPTKPLLVVFDNFFTSYELLHFLTEVNIQATGTVRRNKKDLPTEIKVVHKELEKGEYIWFTKNQVAAYQWKDNKHVTLLSSAHNPSHAVEVSRTQIDGKKALVKCPKAVKQYTQYMRGVDRFDQLKESYTVSRRSKKWWFRIFYYCIDAVLVNSFILYSLNHDTPQSKNKHIEFQSRVAQYLIGSFSSRKRKGGKLKNYLNKNCKTSGSKIIGVPTEIRFSNVGNHIPKQGLTYRRCKLCSTKKNEKRSKILCSTCQVPLCAVPCFAIFHAK